jgi:hypothetical protein
MFYHKLTINFEEKANKRKIGSTEYCKCGVGDHFSKFDNQATKQTPQQHQDRMEPWMFQLAALHAQGIVSAEQFFAQPHIQAEMAYETGIYLAQEEQRRAYTMAQLQAQTFHAMEYSAAALAADAQRQLRPDPKFRYSQSMWGSADGVPTKDFRVGGNQGDHMIPKCFTAMAVAKTEKQLGKTIPVSLRKDLGAQLDDRYPDSSGRDPANAVHSKAEQKVLMAALTGRHYDLTQAEIAHANWAALAAKERLQAMPDMIDGVPKAVLEENYKALFRNVVDHTGRTPLDYARWN